jgi:hypothetical protein
MLAPRTFIVEMTGVLGAGYAPGIFKALTAQLRSAYGVNDPGIMRPLVTRWHIDNTAVRREDQAKQLRVADLIIKAQDPASVTEGEWRELCDLLSETDRRFLTDLEVFPRLVDIVFRRGGRLQDYILFHRAPDQLRHVRRDPRTTPKLQIFLRADLPTIRAAHAEPHLQQLFAQTPGMYNETPELAHATQEEWLERVRHLTGLHYIDRSEVSTDVFARTIAERLTPFLTAFGFKIAASDRPHDIFVSYASEDREFARQLARALSRDGLRVWFAEFELEPGDSITEKLFEGLAKARYGTVILSPSFLARPWTSWPKVELKGLFSRVTNGEPILIPIWLGISKVDVLRVSPPLADLLAIDATTVTIEDIALKLKSRVIRRK